MPESGIICQCSAVCATVARLLVSQFVVESVPLCCWACTGLRVSLVARSSE